MILRVVLTVTGRASAAVGSDRAIGAASGAGGATGAITGGALMVGAAGRAHESSHTQRIARDGSCHAWPPAGTWAVADSSWAAMKKGPPGSGSFLPDTRWRPPTAALG
jgi:hypothetical protein